jgi:hypothetical protein
MIGSQNDEQKWSMKMGKILIRTRMKKKMLFLISDILQGGRIPCLLKMPH